MQHHHSSADRRRPPPGPPFSLALLSHTTVSPQAMVAPRASQPLSLCLYLCLCLYLVSAAVAVASPLPRTGALEALSDVLWS
ncbi:hypothetical protein HYQ45_003310 [Verticillium longisporum]|uniref:Uncharacterized protein n=1 Tax=Verticillium longisporum TaxID=100787 RepID=A0A8I2ZXB5_VERLO|nr:hypothetical protein HYQ45_003310 [Verticillium longisporum]